MVVVDLCFRCPYEESENATMWTLDLCEESCGKYSSCGTVAEANDWLAYIDGSSDNNPHDPKTWGL
ncbi:hypothetical protein AGMMS49975_11250 [Clostridia bacterium]|nr:hypothetical protein AGMMS49975_11250 [Clostridia bacterium]